VSFVIKKPVLTDIFAKYLYTTFIYQIFGVYASNSEANTELDIYIIYFKDIPIISLFIFSTDDDDEQWKNWWNKWP